MEEKIDKRHENSGKQIDQRMKAFLIYEYLLYHSDKDNVVKVETLRKHLKELGISSERRSIYKDTAHKRQFNSWSEARNHGGANS